MALVLSLARLLPQARNNQAQHHWRGMNGNIPGREDDRPGKTMLVAGLGRIGGRLARLDKVSGMTVIGLRRDPAAGGESDQTPSPAPTLSARIITTTKPKPRRQSQRQDQTPPSATRPVSTDR